MARRRPRASALLMWVTCGVLAVACQDKSRSRHGSGDGDGDGTKKWVAIDTDGDGVVDGIDTDGDGIADISGVPIDSDGDGVIDSLDTNGDGIADVALPGFTLPDSGTGGSVNSGTGGAQRASICDGPRIRGGAELLIDDLEHEGEAAIPEVDRRIGAWFVADDLAAGAAQTPSRDMAYPSEGVGRDGSMGFASTLSGFSGRNSEDSGIGWGPQFGFALNEKDDNLCAYDASAFDGVTFCAMSGDGETYTLDFAVPMLLTIPASRGGTCAGQGCGDVHSVRITIGPEWKCDYDIEWARLSQNPRLEHNNKYAFNPANIAQIIWTSWAGDYNVIVDDVRFLGGEMGMGEAGAPGGAGGAHE